jgi:hypothetical protein
MSNVKLKGKIVSKDEIRSAFPNFWRRDFLSPTDTSTPPQNGFRYQAQPRDHFKSVAHISIHTGECHMEIRIDAALIIQASVHPLTKQVAPSFQVKTAVSGQCGYYGALWEVVVVSEEVTQSRRIRSI